MITVYYTNEKMELQIYYSLQEADIYSQIKRKSWIHLTQPTSEEISKVSKITNIPANVINSTLDAEETAHIDIDDDFTLVVVDTPVMEVEDQYPDIHKFSASPFGIIFNNDYFITTTLQSSSIEKDLTSRWMKNFATNKHIKLTIQILFRNAAKFVTLLKYVDKDSELIQARLHESMNNKELFELMSLGKSLVYLSTGLNANQLVLERIKRLELFRQYEEDVDLIEDAIIENRQAMEMCSIHRDILNGAMDAFASVISNNVNTVMKTLTVVTMVLTIPTLVASLFGMNVDLPFEENGFLIALFISLVLSIIGAFMLIEYTKGTKKTNIRKRHKK